MKGAVLLRQAMDELGMTGVALAAELTKMREDGKETGAPTVSRWLNGASPVEPAVLCWLRELIRAKAKNLARTAIAWGPKKSLMIAVSNMKGGVGVSTISTALAVMAKRELNAPTRFIRVNCREDLFTSLLETLNVETLHIGVDELDICTAGEREVVIVEIPKHAAYDIIDKPIFATHPFDIILVPADFASGSDMWATQDFLRAVQTNALVTLLHYTREITMKFASIAANEGFDVTSDQFVPFAFQFAVGEPMLPTSQIGEWSNLQQFFLFHRLFEDLLERVGLGIEDQYSTRREIDSMDLQELLTLVAR
jgi:hypothetical protein